MLGCRRARSFRKALRARGRRARRSEGEEWGEGEERSKEKTVTGVWSSCVGGGKGRKGEEKKKEGEGCGLFRLYLSIQRVVLHCSTFPYPPPPSPASTNSPTSPSPLPPRPPRPTDETEAHLLSPTVQRPHPLAIVVVYSFSEQVPGQSRDATLSRVECGRGGGEDG